MSTTVSDSILSTPLTLPCGLVLPGRLVKAAMEEDLADVYNYPTRELCNLYRLWSTNHNGGHVLITGNVQVDRRYTTSPGAVAIEPLVGGSPSKAHHDNSPNPPPPYDADGDTRLYMLKEWAKAAQQDGTVAIAQLSHAGRQSNVLVTTVSPSPSALRSESMLLVTHAREMTEAEISDVIECFVNAASVCKAAGFAGVELHSAHGYLLSTFLSPRANKRTDGYGGPLLEHRSRLLFEIISRCREAVGGPDFCIGVKLNSSDFQKGGFTEDEAATIAAQLEAQGVDFLEISGGSYENPSMMLGPDGFSRILSVGQLGKSAALTTTELREGYFLAFAEKIRQRLTTMPLMVTGGFRTRSVMESALRQQEEGSGGGGKGSVCDLIGIGRPLCGSHDCVGRMLRGEIDALPRYEATLRLPIYLRFLNYIVVGHLLQLGGLQAWANCNLRRMGYGVEPPTNESNCNLLRDKITNDRWRSSHAAALREMPEGTMGTSFNAQSSSGSAMSSALGALFGLALGFAAAACCGKVEVPLGVKSHEGR